MKLALLHAIKQLSTRNKWLRKVSIGFFIIGMLLTAVAYIADVSEWGNVPAFITLAFIGYILIISSAAILLVNLLREWEHE